jgi:hypothetical protein
MPSAGKEREKDVSRCDGQHPHTSGNNFLSIQKSSKKVILDVRRNFFAAVLHGWQGVYKSVLSF